MSSGSGLSGRIESLNTRRFTLFVRKYSPKKSMERGNPLELVPAAVDARLEQLGRVFVGHLHVPFVIRDKTGIHIDWPSPLEHLLVSRGHNHRPGCGLEPFWIVFF